MNSAEILDREFLTMRAKILELAACFDRLDRAEGDISDAQQMVEIRKGIEILSDSDLDRAKRVQLLFSKKYQENWQQDYQLTPRF